MKMKMKPKAVVIVGYGINCDRELEYAFNKAGADATRVHLKELIGGHDMSQYHIIAIPGGFSFADDTFSGNIFARKIACDSRLKEAFIKHLDAGRLVFGVCNGNQIGTMLNLISPSENYLGVPEVAYTTNNSARYEDRGNIHLRVVSQKSHWLKGIDILHNIPIGHGEGKFYTTEETLKDLYEKGLVVLKYVHEDGSPANHEYPVNPNGSLDDIAGLASGQALMLMPHPERAIEPYNQDGWTRRKSLLKRSGRQLPSEGDGMQIFRNAVNYFL